eukprot:9286278-Pyramimonas_sp.AAC.1
MHPTGPGVKNNNIHENKTSATTHPSRYYTSRCYTCRAADRVHDASYSCMTIALLSSGQLDPLMETQV